MNDDWRVRAERDAIDEEELSRLYDEPLSDWSEREAVNVYRGGKLLRPPDVRDQVELRKWAFRLPSNGPKQQRGGRLHRGPAEHPRSFLDANCRQGTAFYTVRGE
jgi:hypothetical protein